MLPTKSILVAIAFVLSVSLLSSPPRTVEAVIGGDLFQAYPTSTFECLKNTAKWDFMITRAWHSYGKFDTAAPINLNNAMLAGIKYRDVYLFPCALGMNPALQVKETLLGLGQSLYYFGTLWFDIEPHDRPNNKNCWWSDTNVNQNCQFLAAMIAQGNLMSAKMGVYVSPRSWSKIMGDNCTVAADAGLPLWYPGYTGNTTSFSDFSPFGNWKKPAMKQFNDREPNCGVTADMDWYPA